MRENSTIGPLIGSQDFLYANASDKACKIYDFRVIDPIQSFEFPKNLRVKNMNFDSKYLKFDDTIFYDLRQ